MGEIGETVRLGEREMDAQEVALKLQTAVDLVQAKCGHLVDIDLSKIHFKVLEGNIIGEAHEDHVDLDPVLFMHPAARMASALGHELLHKNKAVSNEELIDALSVIYFPNGFNTVYEGQKIIDFAQQCGCEVEQIYRMYYERQFDQIYEMHQLAVAGPHPSVEASQNALSTFRELFPELTFVEEPGKWTAKKPVFPKKEVLPEDGVSAVRQAVDLQTGRFKFPSTPNDLTDNTNGQIERVTKH